MCHCNGYHKSAVVVLALVALFEDAGHDHDVLLLGLLAQEVRDGAGDGLRQVEGGRVKVPLRKEVIEADLGEENQLCALLCRLVDHLAVLLQVLLDGGEGHNLAHCDLLVVHLHGSFLPF